jgi:hypothetical protein
MTPAGARLVLYPDPRYGKEKHGLKSMKSLKKEQGRILAFLYPRAFKKLQNK